MTMKKLLCMGFALLALSVNVRAQANEGAMLEGKWTGKITASNTGRQFSAQLELKPTGEGSWRAVVPGAELCLTLLTPVAWQQVDPNALTIRFLGSKALTGCHDSEVRFERVDDRTFKGRSASGAEILLNRQ